VQELYGAIAELPEDFRLALVAVDVLGLSYREASRALKVREATITTRLFRARNQVARMLDVPERASVAEEPPAPAGAVAHDSPHGEGKPPGGVFSGGEIR
jgi:predicted RNA polymerase sigma factor